MIKRYAEIRRSTRETKIDLTLRLDGSRQLDIATGLGFFDHMLSALAFHANWDLTLRCVGDLQIDDHHTIEDCGLALGDAISNAIGDKSGIVRFGSKYVPLDEALARTVVDFSGRPNSTVALKFTRERVGDVACENLTHFFQSLSASGKFTLHVDVIRGSNDHHKAEAAFKSTALAFREATTIVSDCQVPSTKGVLR